MVLLSIESSSITCTGWDGGGVGVDDCNIVEDYDIRRRLVPLRTMIYRKISGRA